MTKNLSISSPPSTLQKIFAARWKFQRVPASEATINDPVESTCHQLLAGRSTAYGFVARIRCFPVLTSKESTGVIGEFATAGGGRSGGLCRRCFAIGEGNRIEEGTKRRF